MHGVQTFCPKQEDTDAFAQSKPSAIGWFSPNRILSGLMNLDAELPFQSGNQAITMNRTSAALATPRITQKTPIHDFFGPIRRHPKQQLTGLAPVQRLVPPAHSRTAGRVIVPKTLGKVVDGADYCVERRSREAASRTRLVVTDPVADNRGHMRVVNI